MASSYAGPIKLRDGTLLAPVYGGFGKSGTLSSVLYRSSDDGQTWIRALKFATGTTRTRGYVEPALVEVAKGHVLAAHRIEQVQKGTKGLFWTNHSADDGATWSKPKSTDIYSGTCPRLFRMGDGRVLLTYGRRREPFGIYASLSEDSGETWEEPILLRKMPNWNQGYTSSVEITPGRILTVCYGENRRGTTGITGTFWDLP